MPRVSRSVLGWSCVAAVIATGCAGKAARPQPATAADPVRSPEQISVELFQALARNDLEKATGDFSPRMANALSAFDMRQLWQQIQSELGPLQTSSIHSRERHGDLEVREVALRFERGLAIGRVTVRPSNGAVEGLFIRAASAQDL